MGRASRGGTRSSSAPGGIIEIVGYSVYGASSAMRARARPGRRLRRSVGAAEGAESCMFGAGNIVEEFCREIRPAAASVRPNGVNPDLDALRRLQHGHVMLAPAIREGDHADDGLRRLAGARVISRSTMVFDALCAAPESARSAGGGSTRVRPAPHRRLHVAAGGGRRKRLARARKFVGGGAAARRQLARAMALLRSPRMPQPSKSRKGSDAGFCSWGLISLARALNASARHATSARLAELST